METYITTQQLIEATEIIMDGVQLMDYLVVGFCIALIAIYHSIFHIILKK